MHEGIAHALTCLLKLLFQPIYNGIHFMPRQSSVLSSCSLVSFVSCSLLWCMSLHVRFHTAFGLQWFALTQWFPLFISCSLVVHSACVVTFTLRSVYCLVSLWSRSFVVYSACLYGNTLCSSTAMFLRVFSVRTVYSACLYGNTLLCIMRCGLF